MNEKIRQKKTQNSFYKIMGIIGDILLYPIIVISLFTSIMIFMERRTNEVPSVLGFSLVRILSGSMIKSGFEKGDNVLVKRTNTSKLWEGDIIAFYEKYDAIDNTITLTKLETENQKFENDSQIEITGRTTKEDAQKNKSRIIFHEIIGVYADENGTRFFETKGSSNGSADSSKVREDFVVGIYITTPKFVRSLIKWCCSPVGMISLVCFPLGLLVLLEAMSLINQINIIYLEKQLIRGKVKWKNIDIQKANMPQEMETINKIIYCGTYHKKDKEEMLTYLWSNLDNTKTKKDKYFKNQVETSLNLLKNNEIEYWEFWKKQFKHKNEINKIQQMIEQINLKEKIQKVQNNEE